MQEKSDQLKEIVVIPSNQLLTHAVSVKWIKIKKITFEITCFKELIAS